LHRERKPITSSELTDGSCGMSESWGIRIGQVLEDSQTRSLDRQPCSIAQRPMCSSRQSSPPQTLWQRSAGKNLLEPVPLCFHDLVLGCQTFWDRQRRLAESLLAAVHRH
jgi:hypothetical protein